jgi:hypothetical protein
MERNQKGKKWTVGENEERQKERKTAAMAEEEQKLERKRRKEMITNLMSLPTGPGTFQCLPSQCSLSCEEKPLIFTLFAAISHMSLADSFQTFFKK